MPGFHHSVAVAGENENAGKWKVGNVFSEITDVKDVEQR